MYHVLPPAIKRACICVAVKSSYVIPLVYKSVFSLLVVVLVHLFLFQNSNCSTNSVQYAIERPKEG